MPGKEADLLNINEDKDEKFIRETEELFESTFVELFERELTIDGKGNGACTGTEKIWTSSTLIKELFDRSEALSKGDALVESEALLIKCQTTLYTYAPLFGIHEEEKIFLYRKAKRIQTNRLIIGTG